MGFYMKKITWLTMIYLGLFSFNSFAYMFNINKLGKTSEARFEKRTEQAMTMIKLLNEVDDREETQKFEVSISYETAGGSTMDTEGRTIIRIKRDVFDKEDMFKYACLYQVKSERVAEVSISLLRCAEKGKLLE
jgi:hypothetical protein